MTTTSRGGARFAIRDAEMAREASAAAPTATSHPARPRTGREKGGVGISVRGDVPGPLGDVWGSADGPSAFAGRTLRSVDPPDSGGPGAVRVAFRNNTPVPLTLCWVGTDGGPHHFYCLKPRGVGDGGGGRGRSGAAVMVEEGDHIETTAVGHAFVLSLRSVDKPEMGELSEGNGGAGGGVGGGGGDVAPPSIPPRKVDVGIRGCWSACRPGAATLTAREKGGRWGIRPCPAAKSDRALDPADVVGGYRPMMPKAMHVVTVTRRRALSRPRLWGILLRKDEDEEREGQQHRWIYEVSVQEGKLDPTPLDTSDKVYRHIALGGVAGTL